MSEFELVVKKAKKYFEEINRVSKSHEETLKVMMRNGESYDLCRQVIFRNMSYSHVRRMIALTILNQIKENTNTDIIVTGYAKSYNKAIEAVNDAVSILKWSVSGDTLKAIEKNMREEVSKDILTSLVSMSGTAMLRYANDVLEDCV